MNSTEDISGDVSEEAWFYAKDEGPVGPHSAAELRDFLASGVLSGSDLVWTEGMDGWAQVQTVEFLHPQNARPLKAQPEVIEESSSPVRPSSEVHADFDDDEPGASPKFPNQGLLGAAVRRDGEQVRPWVRYFARIIDYTLGQTFVFITSGDPELIYKLPVTPLYAVYFLCGWVLMETCLMSTWGTTPGKWLLKIQVTDSRGRKLEMATAFHRSLQVWIRGMGMGLPIVSLFTLLMSHGRLVQDGATRWDQDGKFEIVHGRFSFRRVAIAVVLFFLFFQLISPAVPPPGV
ncbi:MAG TPA: hypothetical protein DDW23_07570 [Planctomycetes bacterium]|nr:hypothetical protein [Planctomycetota bacterium]